MSLNVREMGTGGDFVITPEGTYIARCIKLIDTGTQTTTGQFGTKEQKKLMISWELLDGERMEDGKPFAVSQWYTASLHEKSQLRQHLEAWRGRKFSLEELEGFDLTKVLGQYCMIQIVHSNDGKYANVNAIMSTKEKPAGVNPLVSFDIDNPDMDIFNSLSENMQKKIGAAPEWKGSQPTTKPEPTTAPASENVKIEDIGESEPVNLADIPF